MKQIICCLLLLCTTLCVRACDVCGGSGSSQNLGILPQFKKHFIGLQYQYRSFSSVYPALSEQKPAAYSEEHYNTAQLWGRYVVSKRLQLFAFVPYQYNRRLKDGTNTDMNGISDISVLANAVVFKTEDSSESEWKHVLLAGGGIKLPTGSYKGITALDRLGLPNMQPGSGAWDVIVNLNYTLRYDNTGINADAVYTITTANGDDYKYGNRLGTAVSGFYWLQAGRVSIMPQVGFRYEYVLHDYDNYSRKWLNEQTGGSLSWATAGTQAYYGKMGFQLSYGIPVAQHYGAGNITAKHRADAGLFFLF